MRHSNYMIGHLSSSNMWQAKKDVANFRENCDMLMEFMHVPQILLVLSPNRFWRKEIILFKCNMKSFSSMEFILRCTYPALYIPCKDHETSSLKHGWYISSDGSQQLNFASWSFTTHKKFTNYYFVFNTALRSRLITIITSITVPTPNNF